MDFQNIFENIVDFFLRKKNFGNFYPNWRISGSAFFEDFYTYSFFLHFCISQFYSHRPKMLVIQF